MMQPLIGLPMGPEWLVLLVVVILLFGGSRLAGLGKGTGRAIREFKEETQGLKEQRAVNGKDAKNSADDDESDDDEGTGSKN